MSQSPINRSRRKFFAGSATLGAAAVGVAVLPGVQAQPPAAGAQATQGKGGGGYRLSEHVKRYYKTTLV